MTRASSQRLQRKNAKYAHKLVVKTAEELARATYEMVMGDNLIYAAWKTQNPDCQNGKELEAKYVAKRTSWFLEPARATLTRLLSQPIDQALKDEIEEALVLDATLRRGRAQPTLAPGA